MRCAGQDRSRDVRHARDDDLHADAEQQERRQFRDHAGALLAEQAGHCGRPAV